MWTRLFALHPEIPLQAPSVDFWLIFHTYTASLGTFWETRKSMDLHQPRRRICHAHRAMLSSEQTGLGLIKDMLLHVVRVTRGTLPSSKASGARRRGKKKTIERILLLQGMGKELEVGGRQKKLEASSKAIYEAPADSCCCTLFTVIKGWDSALESILSAVSLDHEDYCRAQCGQ